MKRIFFPLLFFFIFPPAALARVTPNDIYKEARAGYESALSKLPTAQKEKITLADQTLNEINQTVCARFDEDNNRMAAILEEVKTRKNITNTTVAYGQGSTQLDSAAYWLNYAEEAVAYQKSQNYLPLISQNNLKLPVTNSMNQLKSDLTGLQGKVVKAKVELEKVLSK